MPVFLDLWNPADNFGEPRPGDGPGPAILMHRADAPTAMHRALPLAMLVLASGLAAAHPEDQRAPQLVANGEALLLGGWDAPQPGPLRVVPYEADARPCGDVAGAGYLVDLGGGARLALLGNATHVAATFDLPGPGFVALALDTRTAARTLLVMQEQAVALHALAAAAPNGTTWEARRGVLGIPYDLPGAGTHGFGDVAPEEVGLRLAYDAPAQACGSGGHLTLSLARDVVGEAAQPGAVVHAVALYDPAIPGFLPRPVDSTHVLQANLYLARPGEDAAAVRAALDPQPGLGEALPLGALLLGVALLARRP